MKYFKLLLAFCMALIVLSQCKKIEHQPVNKTIEKTTYVDSVVDGNVAPPFNGVSTVLIENYVNKMYIDILGREPTGSELADRVSDLKAGSLSEASREAVFDDMAATGDYYDRLFEIFSSKMLNGFDSVVIDQQILEYQYIKILLDSLGDYVNANLIQFELERLYLLQDAKADLRADIITLNEFVGRILENTLYDQINMGSENFVLSAFENLFNRLPTVAELTEGVSMVDGFVPGTIFNQDGTSKGDFVDITTTVEEFYEGRITDAYLNLLLREPTDTELEVILTAFLANGDLKEVQKSIIKTEEYAGF